MKHITILVPKGAILGSLEGPRQVFTEVNGILESMGKPALFKVQLAGLSSHTAVQKGLYTIYTDVLAKDIEKTDLIIIPAMDGDMVQNLKDNEDALKVSSEAVEAAGYKLGKQVFIALDPAASELWDADKKGYKFFKSKLQR